MSPDDAAAPGPASTGSTGGAGSAAAPVAVSPHLVLEYVLAPDYLQRRAAVREEHLALVEAQATLVLAGALDDASRALLVFRGDDRAAVEAFARADPYVVHGLVASWSVRPWNVVAGDARDLG